jgi:uncharacterized FAD-dependent dehydrogenase
MIRVRQVKVGLDEDTLKGAIAKKLGILESDILDMKIQKKSLDARKKEDIHYVYEVDVKVKNERSILKSHHKDILLTPREEYHFPKMGKEVLSSRPVVVGSGPAGLFCAYLLAEHGYRPLILERGEKMEERVQSVSKFFEEGILNPNSNVQFGEGGAGTFSDGKLNTMVKDKMFRGKKVFSIFVEHGAPKEIMYLQKPHIGTDLLCDIVKNIRHSIIQMGGEFRYSTCLTDIKTRHNQIVGVEINHQEVISCSVVVLAIGHSARDTFSMLYDRGVSMVGKPFAVGVRIQHPQQMIQLSQFATLDKRLPVADYKLTYTTKSGRGVYSFCMCPGGYVVNASSEEGRLVVNGMSYHARDSKNANSALVVTVGPEDFGHHSLDGMKFQQMLEEKAYLYGNGSIPVQLYDDFCHGIFSTSFGEVLPVMKGSYTFSDLNDILPNCVSSAIQEAMPVFGKKIKGFDRGDAILAGVETRTSSPVRILRNDLGEANILGLYPCGEGSGYAGGITTAAMDGIKVAEWIASKYHNLQSNS